MDYEYTSAQFAARAERGLGSIVYKYKKFPEMGYSTYSKWYENCVVPIVDHASGVWGYKLYSTIDQLQNKAPRIFLGIHRFAPILGVEGDMGWLNRGRQRHLNILRLWNRIIRMRESRLPKQVFKYEYNNGNKDWCYEMREIFKALDLEYMYENL